MNKEQLITNLLTKIGSFTPEKMTAFCKFISVDHPEGWRWLDKFVKLIEKEWRWKENNGVISFTLPSTDGKTVSQRIEHLRLQNFTTYCDAQDVLMLSHLKPTIGVINKVFILKDSLFDNNTRTNTIRLSAHQGTFTNGLKLKKPNWEVACLIREYLADWEIEAMGIKWIVTMHDPIKGKYLAPFSGKPWHHNILECISCDKLRRGLGRGEFGFAFVEQ